MHPYPERETRREMSRGERHRRRPTPPKKHPQKKKKKKKKKRGAEKSARNDERLFEVWSFGKELVKLNAVRGDPPY